MGSSRAADVRERAGGIQRGCLACIPAARTGWRLVGGNNDGVGASQLVEQGACGSDSAGSDITAEVHPEMFGRKGISVPSRSRMPPVRG